MPQTIRGISGVGSTTVAQLDDMGITSLEELAEADPSIVNEYDVSISERRMKGFIEEAKESAIIIQTGDEVVEEYENKTAISTGIEELDEKLEGGWHENHVVAIGGDTGSGKTQLAFQACGEAVKQTGDPAVYIETEPDRYTGSRIRQMYGEEVQEKVHKISVRGEDALDQQLLAYRAVQNKMDNVSVVVVDSFTARFRMAEAFTGRENLNSRSDAFREHLNQIEVMSKEVDCPVLLNCQIYKNPSQYGTNNIIYGSTLMLHIVNYVVKMKSKSGQLTEFRCRNHPEVGDFDMLLQINEDGIEYAD